MAKHRICRAPKRKGVLVGLAGLSAVALTSGVAAASTPNDPLPPIDCPAAVQSILDAQITVGRSNNELHRAQNADRDARTAHDTAVTNAQATYKAGPQDADALATRDAAISKADADYEAGGTAAAVTRAQRGYDRTGGILAKLRLNLGQICTAPPASSTAPAPPAVQPEVPADTAPAPEVVDAHLPVTH
jgi:hypothetical protein